MPSAHPETGHPHVDVPILLVSIGAAILVALVAVLVPAREDHAAMREADDHATASWSGPLTRAQWLVRGGSLAVLVLAVAAGRFGADAELDNLAPALVVGAALPLLVAGALVLGRLWRWLDPWDTLARLLAPRDRSSPPGHVWPAVVLALPGLWFLGVHPRPFDPRAVGTALAAYSVVTLAGCLAWGRARWLGSAEPLGLLLSWLGLVPRRALARWEPPRGAGTLLGVVAGGLLFGVVRRTELWGPVLTGPHPTLWSTAGLLLACLLGAGLALGAGRAGRAPDAGALVARALVPAVAGVLLAVALSRNRLTTSLQLLPGLAGDPLGHGWDLLGTPTSGLVAAPLGAAGLVALQITVVVLLHLLSATVVPRARTGDDRLPAIVVLAVSVTAAVTAVSWH